MSEKTPQNDKGQSPTRSSPETVERLEEKKRDAHGKADRERIEEQEREVSER